MREYEPRLRAGLSVRNALRPQTEVVALRKGRSRPTRGVVTFGRRGFNPRDAAIRRCRRGALMLRRPA